MAALGEYGAAIGGCNEPSPDEKEAWFFVSALRGRRRVLDLGCGPGSALPLVERVG